MEKKNFVTSDMLVGQVVNQYPESVEALFENGMHCIGCPSSQAESLADACMVHGLDVAKVVDAVNKKIEEARN